MATDPNLVILVALSHCDGDALSPTKPGPHTGVIPYYSWQDDNRVTGAAIRPSPAWCLSSPGGDQAQPYPTMLFALPLSPR